MQFLMYTLGDESVPMPAPTPELMKEMDAFVEEATKAGVLLATGGVGPTALGAKVTLKDGDVHRHRRTLRGGQGAHRWLGPVRVPRQGGGDRVDEAVPVHRRGGRVTDPAGLRSRVGRAAPR